VSTPSQRLWAHRHEWDAEVPVSERERGDVPEPMTLVRTAERISAGTPLRDAVADFLDDLRWARGTEDVDRRIDGEPPSVDDHCDCYLAAVAEHVAQENGLAAPSWCRRPERFLDHFWWPSRTPGLRARAIVESPAAFRRRGVFIGRSTLTRV
jgi:hypothetical protein